MIFRQMLLAMVMFLPVVCAAENYLYLNVKEMFLLSQQASRFEVERGDRTVDTGRLYGLGVTQYAGVAFDQPNVRINLGGGVGYLNYGNFDTGIFAGQLEVFMKLEDQLMFGPCLEIQFYSPHWWPDDDIELTSKAPGFLIGLGLNSCMRFADIALQAGYLAGKFDVESKNRYYNDKCELNFSGVALNFSIRFKNRI